jgi:toxin-antitoxin system PIN domain toxin
MKKGYSELLLLDVNVLLALAWPNHQFHVIATRRLERSKGRWATCALTQLGFIRLSSNPVVVGVPKSPWEAASLLALLAQDPHHFYLDSLPPPTTRQFLRGFEQIHGSKQVTDSYLMTLAKQNQARLVTFDSRLASFSPAEGDIEVLSGI